jgi:S-DNA-T family DNA segregation ATPase FtsK/SpoIIIE
VIEKHFLAKLPGEEEAIITDTKKVVYTLNAFVLKWITVMIF